MPEGLKQPPIVLNGLSPENLLERIWQELTRAVHDRHHEWKRPALASIGLDGTAQVRTVILRNADQDLRALTIYTDTRSKKCAELIKYQTAQLVFWSSRLNWQLRISASVTVHCDGDLVTQAWAKVSQTKASKDFLSKLAPGTAIHMSHEHETAQTSDESHHLAVLNFQISSMDLLALDREGHQRVHITSDGHTVPIVP